MKITKKTSISVLVWRTWKNAFQQNSIALLLTFILYNASAFVDQMLKPTFFKSIFDALSSGGNPMKFFYFIIICHATAWCLSRLGDRAITLAESNIIKLLRDKAMFGLMKKSSTFFSNNFAGSLVAKSKRFSAQSEAVIDQVVFTLSKTLLLVVYILIYMFIIYTTIAWIFLVWTIVFIVFTIIIAKKRIFVDAISSEKDSKTTGVFSDIISSLSYLRSYAAEHDEYIKFTNVTLEEMKARRKAWYLGNFQWAMQGLLVAVLEIIVMYYLIQGVMNKQITIGTMAMVQVYIISLAMYMYALGQALIRMRTGFAEAYEMAEILSDTIDNTEEVQAPDNVVLTQNSISFKDLSFAYNERKVVEDFSLVLEPGKHYGMVGTSGAGKTTISQLLLRHHDLQVGEIHIDVNNISDLSKSTIRSLIAYVPQMPQFPSRSIIEILKLGNKNATQEMINQACIKAGCDFIWEKFEDKFETKVGERGVKLSGGEAQRLAIATAIIKDAPIIIMDEPTSALDAKTEQIIQSSIKTIFAGKTMVVIAHRLSTVAVLDEILFLKNGKIDQRGTHEEMLVNSDDYKYLWDLQTNPILKATLN